MAKADGKHTRYNASKGVVLATGDFSQDKDMVAKYCPIALPFGNGGKNWRDDSGPKLAWRPLRHTARTPTTAPYERNPRHAGSFF